MKLDKKAIQKVAIFSSALTLVPQEAYASTMNIENMPSHATASILIFGGLVLMGYREIKKEERERLYEIHEHLIPAQIKAIKYLKSSKKSRNKNKLKYEIRTEKEYLEYLKEKRSELCERLKIDEFDDEQMEAFIEKERLKQEDILTRGKEKVKTLLAR
ncbi:MAG: hypothetical protein IKF91_01885 [Bacilli bacterium]|nr:hypothetical protein [Bacilli bacterium]